ncbi:IgA receptor precursor, putative [Perkinsus marinus ATCC 50983]|uniref:IgA receptor, putative n=1 Tax=Perkinsus marinus (strain ATCC 50983 / TXsc) TaxID=423536 RepID=C5LPW5_PERM5|nr:IgA receptor precursor, putative [Perkinsus marinus ATCC 50983]EER01225.1 IgA receptor precursor, putative [Perkinsus marinus ATCC 50983]|eukprot:XP_002768507.1 IgA receptor precursor, putative [Perkinsus marinus ATCC 50983]
MSVERENREQLQRESQLEQKERYRRERVAAAQKQIEARGQHVKELLDARMEDNRNRLQSLEVELAARRADASAQELLEDQRLREWQMGQSLVISEKSQEEEKKRAALNGKIAEIEMVRALQGQLIRERFDEKISTAERRKETDLAQQILKQKTAHLKLMDARERKEELERVDRHRRDLLGREIEDKEAKISTMLFTKDLLMAQRKILIQQQECLNGKPVNIRQIMPGPAHYSRSMNSVMENPAPKISTSNSKLLIPGSTEFELKKAKSIPPPGSYDPKVLPSGSGLWDEGKISMSKSPKTTYLDEERAIRALAPGPGT